MTKLSTAELYEQLKFYGVRRRDIAAATGLTEQYVQQVLAGVGKNEAVLAAARIALQLRKKSLKQRLERDL